MAIALYLGAIHPAWAADAEAPEAAVRTMAEGSGEPEAEKTSAQGLSGSYLAMKFAHSQGDKEAAIDYLRKALKRAPKDDALAGQLMVMQLLAGQMEDAMKLAHRLEKNPDRELITDMLLAIEQVKREKYADASATLSKAFDEGFGTLWLPLVSAWLDYGQGKVKQPLKLEAIAPKAGKVAPLIYYHLGLINNLAGFDKEGLADLEKAASDQNNIPFRVMEALAYEYRKRGDDKSLKQLLQRFGKAHPELAFATDADDFLGSKPPVGNVQEGVAEVLFTMASILFTAEAGQDTLLYLRMALYLKPDFAAAQMILANLLEMDGDYAEANAIYHAVKEDNPFYGRARLRAALNLDKQNKTNEALAALDALAQMAPDRHEALVAKGDVLRAHERFKEAAEAYSLALSRAGQPQAPMWAIYFARGACYERVGDWNSAEKDLQKALELNPNQPDVLNYLGYSWLTRGEHIEEAKALLEKAIAARPNDAHIIDSMGWALYNAGDYSSAISYLERAVDLMPSDPTVNEHLGDALWQSGRKQEAKFQWQRVLVYDPEPAQAEAVRHKLESGLPATGVPVPPTAQQSVPPAAATP